MKRRILSLLLAIAMVATMFVMPAYATTEEPATVGKTDMSQKCPCCDVAFADITDWQPIDLSTYVTGKKVNIPAGHYYLEQSFTGHASQIRMFNSPDVVIDLRGNSFTTTENSRCFYVEATSDTESSLTLLDSVGGGQMTSAYQNGGAVLYAITNGVINVFGGHYIGSPSLTYGGTLYAGGSGTLNIYDGYFEGGNATTKGGTAYMNGGTLNIYGGTLLAGTAPAGTGDCIGIGKGTLNISGGNVAGATVTLASGGTCAINVSGAPTIGELDLTGGGILTLGELTQGADITINAEGVFTEANEKAADYAQYFTAPEGKVISVVDNTLSVVEAPATEPTTEPTTAPTEPEVTEPEATEPESTDGYVMIDKIADLTAGTYKMAAYVTADSNKEDLSANPYHLAKGSIYSGDLETTSYSFADGALTVVADATDDAADIQIVAVDGKDNTYYIMYNGQYLCSTANATNRKLAWTDTATEWVASDNAKGGITMTSNDVYLGSANAASRFIRSYKGESTLVYGLVFFAASNGETPDVPVDPTEPEVTEPTTPEVVVPETPEEIINAAYALADGESLPYSATLTGVITAVNTPYSAQYGNVTVTMVVGDMTDKPIECFRLKGEGADKIGVSDTITVTGTLTNYGGTIEFAAGCTLDSYVEGQAPEENLTTPEEIVNAAYALEVGASLEKTYTLTGVITEVGSAYSEQYGNITVTMVVGDMTDKPIVCYRLKGEGAELIGVGDTITVTGSIKNYDGTIEFVSGCTLDSYVLAEDPEVTEPTTPEVVVPETPEEIINAAYALADGESLPYSATLTGVITAVNTPYSEQYGNITVTMVVGDMTDKPIECFRLKGEGADKIGVSDTITVTGTLTNYGGTIEFAAGCTLDSYVEGQAPEENLTTPEEIVNAAYALEVGASLEKTYTLTGVITEVGSAYSEQYGNITVTMVVGDMTDKPIVCYRLKGEGAELIGVGDTITVTGSIKNYDGTVEFVSGCTLDSYVLAEEPGTDDMIGDYNDDKLVTNEDVVYLLWHSLYPDQYTITTDADFDNDGDVTNADVVYLLWHTLYPDQYPLVKA